MTVNVRWLRLAVPAGVLAAWLAASFGQQQTPPPAAPRPPAENAEADDTAAPPAADEEDDVFIPTEELAPDAAVTFPVDI